ncbi:MAG: DUF3048 domain-containing protein [Patescibacteria group bacterium]|jgi:hypothetical protein
MLTPKALKSFIIFPTIAFAGFLFFGLAKNSLALDRALVYGPKPNTNVLDQPLTIAGIAPVNSQVWFILDNKVIGKVNTLKPKKKKDLTASFTFTYKKTIKAGMHTLGTQVYKNKEWSEKTSQAFSVPEKWFRKIDGMLVKTSEWNKLPFGVMIENTPEARPQAGLGLASVVYETLAEGGVTRFLAIFPQSVNPKLLGPIRSSRPYYVDWAREYSAIYIHAGGSRDAFEEIGRLGVRSFDALTRKGSPYAFRNCSGVHCLFTNKGKLNSLVTKNKLNSTPAKSTGWIFKSDVEKKQRGKNGKKLTIDFNGRTYRVDWAYDQKTNRYKRSNGGVVAKDRNTGKQITAANVVVMRVPKEKVLDRKLRISLKLTGKGNATLYRDGNAIEVQWRKSSASARTKFYSKKTGQEIEFNRGTTWVEVVPGARKVTYK